MKVANKFHFLVVGQNLLQYTTFPFRPRLTGRIWTIDDGAMMAGLFCHECDDGEQKENENGFCSSFNIPLVLRDKWTTTIVSHIIIVSVGLLMEVL